MRYKLIIQPEVFDDIQQGIDWYNSRQKGLGKSFFNAVQQEYKILRINPGFQVRYDQVKCLPVKKFPYMIHYYVNEESKTVIIMGVINTYLNPDNWEKRTGKIK